MSQQIINKQHPKYSWLRANNIGDVYELRKGIWKIINIRPNKSKNKDGVWEDKYKRFARVIDGRYVYFKNHRVVYECFNNINLDGESGGSSESIIVHHKNGNRMDNRPENLVMLTHGQHSRDHRNGFKCDEITIQKCKEARKRYLESIAV